MIKSLDFSDSTLAQRALDIQKLAYRIEADLIGFEGIPPLHETLEDLRQSSETFLGYFVEDVLAGMISYSIEDTALDIGRLVVHPDYFRRGIGQALVRHVESLAGIEKWIVSTGALNHPARKLYENLGFHCTGEVMLAEGVAIALYEKVLTP